MAKEIDLTKRVIASTPVPPKKPKVPDGSLVGAPPPAQLPRAPLPAGQVVDAAGRPVQAPPDVQRMAQAVARQQAQNVVPDGVDPSYVAKQAEVVDIEQLSPTQQSQVTRSLQSTLGAFGKPGVTPPTPSLESILRKPPPQKTVPQAPDTMTPVPGYQPPAGTPPPTLPDPAAYPEVNDGTLTLESPPEAPQQPPLAQGWQVEMPAPIEAASEPEPPAETPEPPLTTVAGDMLQFCPHCGWDLAMDDPVEPEYADKQIFLQSILGQKGYEKDYALMGGAVRVRFRTLTTREVDVIYKQAFLEREQGKQPTVEDFWEVVNRYRLYLQLVRIESTAFLHELPDGYDEQSNPHAQAHYKFSAPADPRATGLPDIADFIESDVLRTESLQRVVNNTCARFNRLVAKLEGMIDNSDFWKPTEEQS